MRISTAFPYFLGLALLLAGCGDSTTVDRQMKDPSNQKSDNLNSEASKTYDSANVEKTSSTENATVKTDETKDDSTATDDSTKDTSKDTGDTTKDDTTKDDMAAGQQPKPVLGLVGAEVSPDNPRMAIFKIKAGTGKGPWNTANTPVMIDRKYFDAIIIMNEDSVPHQLHTGGAPCPHAPAGDKYQCNLGANIDFAGRTNPATYDHNYGGGAGFFIKVYNSDAP